jgi:hypothetical protein
MLERTWPYGTTKRVRVLTREIIPFQNGLAESLVVAELESSEAFILIGNKAAAGPGDLGTITFREGGPTGGYWDFEPDAPLTFRPSAGEAVGQGDVRS